MVVVAPESANPGYGEYVEADANHLNVCKPESREDPIYSRVVSFIRRAAAPHPPQ